MLPLGGGPNIEGQEEAGKQKGGASMQRRQLRVMVLDASPTSRTILAVILRREGHRVVCFGDPLQALRFLSRHGPADLLFLGLDLPGMDGLSVHKPPRLVPAERQGNEQGSHL